MQILMPNHSTEYEKVANLYKQTSVSFLVYFEMTFVERTSNGLSKNFDMFVYKEIYEWLWHKPMMNPPHFRN